MKRFLFSLVVAAVASSVSAQGKGKLELGLQLGGNQSTVSNNNYSEDPSYSFNVGASAEYYFSNEWGLKVRAIYDRKGFDEGYYRWVDDNIYLADFNLDYLTIPVTAVWHFGDDNAWFLDFGLYYATLLRGRETSHDADLKDDFRTSDAGVAFGIGYKFPVSDRLRMFVQLDGQGGFTDIYKGEGDVQTSRLALNVGCNFLLF
ncbi:MULTISPECIES: porin family protein [unclassified Flavobacterium]|uniref:porin family protein n=1 Tax=unclassified Flavobacterium TaxID=196869 RepID=UPI001F142DB5|nr:MULTISPECIES: porin family protein [unclassified Flavobacterium]UMY65230.1 PorT family protein [Flavobacterium sp. HJ-32-4]